jgi:hypothetical protein
MKLAEEGKALIQFLIIVLQLGLICGKNMLEKTVRKFPHLHDAEYAKLRFGDDFNDSTEDTPLVLP